MPEGAVGKAPENGVCPKCGKPWDVYHSAEATLMPLLTTDSILGLITGQKGKGKTFLSMWLAWAVMNFPHTNWHVVSNVVFGRFKGMKNNQPQDDPEALGDYEQVDPPHPKMHVATDYVELFRLVSELLMEADRAGRKIHILFIMDEAPVGGIGSRNIQGQKGDVRQETMSKLLTLTRKITMSVVMIAIHERMVGTWFREDERNGGIGQVRVVFSKYEDDIRKVARDSAKYYGEKYEYAWDIDGVPLDRLVAVKVPTDDTFNDSLLYIDPCPIAKPLPMLKLGDINYDTFSIAGWQMGNFNGKTFQFDEIIKRVSGLHSSKVARILYEYFHGEQPLEPQEQKAAEDAGEDVTAEQMEQVERELHKDLVEPRSERAAPKLIELQRHINMDREVLKATGEPKYKTYADLYEAAGLSRARFTQFRNAGRIDLSYRSKPAEDKDAEDTDDV